jgi:hypothetical protein
MIYDVRQRDEVVTGIVFSEQHHKGCVIAHAMEPDGEAVRITDGHEYMYVIDKYHAQDMIKALNKAIELGWLK